MPELTLVWPNGADLAPEFLREKLRVVAWPSAERRYLAFRASPRSL
jgi:hypothetical protein